MDNFTEYVSTVQARDESPNILVVDDLCSIPINTQQSEASMIDESITGFCIHVNYPRLRTKVITSILRLSFLKGCRILRRPPPSFRIKSSKLTPLNSFRGPC